MGYSSRGRKDSDKSEQLHHPMPTMETALSLKVRGGLPTEGEGKESACQETRVLSLGREDPLDKHMAIHSSGLAWRIPWTEKPVRLQSIGSQRVGHN